MLCRSQIQNTMAIYVKMYASLSEFVSKDELIQSEIQSDIISEKSLSLPAEVFRFRSVKYTPPKLTRFAYRILTS